jgi:hypothetical protein
VRKNSRSGVCMLRAQAVRPENADDCSTASMVSGRFGPTR